MGGIAWIRPATAAPPPSGYSMVIAIVNAGEGRLVVEQARQAICRRSILAVGSQIYAKDLWFEIVLKSRHHHFENGRMPSRS